MEMKFYECPICGQIMAVVRKTNADIICCGQPMKEIIALSDDSTNLREKHVPVYETANNRFEVRVGSIPHPMTKEHYIEWIAIKTNKGNQRKCLKPGDSPKAYFCLDKDEEVEQIYAYCNIHSLWKNQVRSNGSTDCKECKIHK